MEWIIDVRKCRSIKLFYNRKSLFPSVILQIKHKENDNHVSEIIKNSSPRAGILNHIPSGQLAEDSPKFKGDLAEEDP